MENLKDLRSRASRLRDSADRAKAFALKLLVYRQRSESELRERLLMKGFSAEVVEKVIGELRNSGFIDDSEAARSFVRIAEQRLLGKKAIERLLFERGISAELIKKVMEDYNEMEVAMKTFQKWLRRHNLDDRDSELRFRNFMLGRGYSTDTINDLIKKIKEERNDIS